MTGHMIRIKGYKLDKSGKPIRTPKGKSVSQKIAERKSKKIRVVKAAVVVAALLIAPEAHAGARKICNTWTDHCWWENDAGQVIKRPRPKRHAKPRRKPEVRAYVKRDDDDRLQCLDVVRVVGSQWATSDGAETSAQKAWMEQVRWRYGESAMTIEAATGYAKRCSRSSIGEVASSVLHRCEVQARPCRPVFESK